jgi:tetratricopeptide (TPR) repeat protein
VYKTEYDLGLIDALMEYVRNKKELLEIPIIKVYYHLYNLFRYPDEETHYFEVKQALKGYNHLFKPAERSDLYIIAINYCIGKMNIGVQKFLREAFEMYQEGIEGHFLIINEVLNHLDFRNIVSIGTTLKEFDWVSNFIEKYQGFLALEYRENFVQFSLAKLHFERGDYDQAQRLLIQFDIDDVLLNLSAKSMLIKIYYEEGEINTLESLLESLRTYINRKKSITYHKIIYNNLIRFTKKLVRLPPRNKALKERLRKQIEEANPLPERKWLLEQLDKL